MEACESQINQVFVKLLDGKHKVLNFNTPSISVSNLKGRIQTLTSIPSNLQLLLFNNSRILHDHQTLSLTQFSEDSQFSYSNSQSAHDQDFNRFCSADLPENAVSSNGSQFGAGKFPVVVNLLLRLRGGKGGFGSLLRGAATKAGQKKTNNFDACRDMSGRRLRHVNAEKKLEEWREGAEERKLEKMAEDYLKKKLKEVAKSGRRNGSDSSEKYVAKYKEDSAKCMEEVEKSVRESVLSSKRKKHDVGSESDSKRFKIWLGKRKFDDTDSEDESDEDKEMENEKSVIIDNGSHSDSGKEEDGSSGSITGGQLESVSLGQGSSESGSEEEDAIIEKSVSSGTIPDGCSDDDKSRTPDSLEENLDDHCGADTVVPHEYDSGKTEEAIVSQSPDVSVSELEVVSSAEVGSNIKPGPAQKELVPASAEVQEYHSAEELEVLGMERLKSELQKRGLKCGGTLQERAARLFLLKTTPLDKLPKKLFAKK